MTPAELDAIRKRHAGLRIDGTTPDADIAALLAHVADLEAALRDIISTYERRSELFTNADDCAGNLADRARKAAQELIDYEKIGGPDYLHWQERFDALSAALEKTT